MFYYEDLRKEDILCVLCKKDKKIVS
jgi:hypothetical protein